MSCPFHRPRFDARSFVLFAIVICVALGEPAQANDNQAKRLLKQGISLFADGAFNRSIQTLRRARSQTSNKELLGQINLFVGLNHASGNRTGAARAAFRAALTNDPRIQVDPQRHKPEFVKLFAAVRRSTVGELVVTADPAGREVLIDGEVRGRAPFRGPFVPGRYEVQVRGSDGEATFSKAVNISAGQSVRLVVIGRKEATSQPLVIPPQPEPPVKPTRRRRLWTWIAAGGAVASAAVAIGTALSAGFDHDAGCTLLAGSMLPCEQRSRLISATDAQRYDDLRQDVSTKRLISNVAIGTAVALGVASVLLYWLEGRAAGKETPRVEPAVQAAIGAANLSMKITY